MNRGLQIWGAIFVVCATGLCFVPLFNLLGFEFSLAMTVPATVAAGWLGIREVRALRSSEAFATRRHQVVVERLWLYATLRGLGLLALGLVPISLNALRVQNCNYGLGLAFYGVLPVTTLLIGTGWAIFLELFRPGRGGRWYMGVIVVSVARALWHVYEHPPVDVFHPFVGYYPGPIYDVTLPLESRLLWSRAEDLAWAAAVVCVARMFYTATEVRLSRRADAATRILFRSPPRVALAGVALVSAIALRLWATRIDVHRDAASIQAALGATRTTEHLRLYHPASWPPDRVERLLTELEFRHAEQKAFFGFAPERLIEVYAYPDQRTKKRLMGAGRTQIAKPWQYAVHVNDPRVGGRVLEHEIAHVFAAELAGPPFHIAMDRGVLPNMSIVEGLAVAATWESTPLDGHQWSLAMFRRDRAPSMKSILSPSGFVTAHNRTAYTLCGSFMRWQRDTQGPEAVARAYGEGGYPSDGLDDLLGQWRRFLDAQPTGSPEQRKRADAIAEVRFGQRSIFRQVCAREIAGLRAEMEAAATAGRDAEADALAQRILGFVPAQPDVRLRRVELLAAQDRAEDARTLAEQLVADGRLGALRRAAARERLADLLADSGDGAAARSHYDALLSEAWDRAAARRIFVKRAALDRGEAGAAVGTALRPARGNHKPEIEAAFERALAADPEWAVAHYLLGRWLALGGETRREEGIERLEGALAMGLPTPDLRLEARRALAHAWFAHGRFDRAMTAFDGILAQSEDLALQAGERNVFETWRRRAAFFRAHHDG